MKILVASSELTPFARTGGLADAVAELTAELFRLGHEVSVVIPYYRSIREGKIAKSKKTRVKFNVQVGNAGIPVDVFETQTPEGVQVFLIARDEYFDRSGFYGVDGRDYQDNAARFVYFTKAAVELARRMNPSPEILLANGWQTALLPVFVAGTTASLSDGSHAPLASLSGQFLELRLCLDELARRLFLRTRCRILREHELLERRHFVRQCGRSPWLSAMSGKPRRPSMVVDWKMSSANISTSSMGSRPVNKSKTGNSLQKVRIGSVQSFSRPPGSLG